MIKQALKGLVFTAAILGLGVTTAQAGDAENGYNKQKVVYHINNLDSANGALRNVKNHLNAVGDKNVDMVVVAHSKGATFMVDGTTDSKGNTFESTIAELADRGVKFNFCANTIRGLKIDKKMINPVVEIVPSGVAEVAHLQQQGYLYVKP